MNNHILGTLIQQKNLTRLQAAKLAEMMIRGILSPVITAAILTALHAKGETAEEVQGFIKTLRGHMITITAPPGTIDTCGTGGDGAGSFNISTASAFVVAGAGVPVAKHGNRAASSRCGSADALEALGARIDYAPPYAEKLLKETGFVFLFAPLYHPALKQVAPIRKELGIRTIFNFLGPFLNPALVTRQIIGVPNLKSAMLLKEVALRLNYTDVIIVTAEDLMDEISTGANTHCLRISHKKERHTFLDPTMHGFKKTKRESIKGGNAHQNAQIITDIFKGKSGPHRDIVVLNAATALEISGTVQSIDEGIQQAHRSIDSGLARRKLEKFIQLSKDYAKNS